MAGDAVDHQYLRFLNPKLPANPARRVFVDLAMPGHRSLLLISGIDPDGMTASLAQEFTALVPQVLNQILAFHVAISPAGFSSISVLALKCR